MEIEFEYNLGNVILNVNADITQGYPAQLYGAPEDCYPGEDDTAEITDCVIKATGEQFEFDDLHIRRRAILKNGFPVYDSVEELMEIEALEKWRDGK